MYKNYKNYLSKNMDVGKVVDDLFNKKEYYEFIYFYGNNKNSFDLLNSNEKNNKVNKIYKILPTYLHILQITYFSKNYDFFLLNCFWRSNIIYSFIKF